MKNVTECQKELIRLGYLPELDEQKRPNADGVAGQKTLDAFNHFLASKGKPPITTFEYTLTRLNAELFPEDAPPPKPPASNPITDFLTGLAVKAALSQLKGLLPMNFLEGYKTYIIAVLMIGLAVAGFLGWAIPGVNTDPGALILAAIGLITGRTATAKLAAGK